MNLIIKRLLKIAAVLGICGIGLYTGICIKEGRLVSVAADGFQLTPLSLEITSGKSDLNKETYTFDQAAQLKLDIDVGDVEIKPAEDNKVTVITKLESGFESKVTCKDHLLDIQVKDTRNNHWDVKKQTITIYLPENISLERADIHLALGTLKIKQVTMNNLSVIANLGDVDLKNVTLANPDITLNMGDFDFEGTFSGTFHLENNMGDADLTIKNTSETGLNLHVDMGEIEINDRTVVSLSGSYTANENADNQIIAKLNLGDLEIKAK